MSIDEYLVYGDLKHAGEFARLDPKLKQVAQVASILSKILYGELLITTSIFRKKTNDSGIHEAFRAIDFAPLKSEVDTYRLIEIMNSIYTYDPQRPELKVVDPNPFHGTAQHFHFQVHPNTTFNTNAHKLDLIAQASQDAKNFEPIKLGTT